MTSAPAIATVQSDRFHNPSSNTISTNVQIDVSGLTITVGETDLVRDTRLFLQPGTRYGFIGRNGVGKSTLLRLLGEGGIPTVPKQLRALYVDQIQVDEDTLEDLSVVDAVIAADKDRTRLLEESEALQEVIDDEKASMSVARSIAQKRRERELEEAKVLAERRSGTRGHDARKQLLKSLKEDEEKKANENEEVDPSALLGEIFEKLDLMDSESAEVRARDVLTGLGFSKKRQEAPFSSLSGGWKTRVALARALFMNPDVLLLDEPTNHLDMKAIAWLEEYLSMLPMEQILVVVSHDRHFLNATTDCIIRLRDGELTYHQGNYDDYEKNLEDRTKMKKGQMARFDRKKKHMEQSIQKAVKHAKSSGDDKRLGMVASRKKKIENMGMEKTEDGKRFKRSNRAGYFLTTRVQIELEKEEAAVHFSFPPPDGIRQKGRPLVQLRSISFTYPGETKPTLKNITLDVEMGDRIGIVGNNGAGKSTLVSTLEGTLKPTAGKVDRLQGAPIARFDQKHVDFLTVGARGEGSALNYIMDNFDIQEEAEARALLGSFGIGGIRAAQPLKTLSGGQRVRVTLASLFAGKHLPALLVLDEVTNHLDLWSVQGMVDALEGWEGAVIIVSHDRWFLEQVCQSVYRLQRGQLTFLENGVEEYIT